METIMENGHVIITFDGMETVFDAKGNVNFDRDQLLVRVQTSTGISGWHWDRFAVFMQFISTAAQHGNARRCEIMLGLKNGREKKITVSDFQTIELKPAGNLILIKGGRQAAFINLDYLKWYRLYNE